MPRSITPRAAWGYQLRRPVPHAPAKRDGLSLHYGAGPEWIGLDAPRGLQSVHFGRGFSAIGYTFVCDLAGNLFHGRPVNLRGAHTLGHNTTWHAVCVPADGDTTPTDALIDSLAWLLRHGQIRGWWPLNMAPHHDLSPTSCPGPLDAIIDEVVSQASTKSDLYSSTAQPPTPTLEDVMIEVWTGKDPDGDEGVFLITRGVTEDGHAGRYTMATPEQARQYKDLGRRSDRPDILVSDGKAAPSWFTAGDLKRV